MNLLEMHREQLFSAMWITLLRLVQRKEMLLVHLDPEKSRRTINSIRAVEESGYSWRSRTRFRFV
jgi:hypothetical protein